MSVLHQFSTGAAKLTDTILVINHGIFVTYYTFLLKTHSVKTCIVSKEPTIRTMIYI